MINKPSLTVPLQPIESRILFIRGQRVMIDASLAELYGVPTKMLNQAIKRNIERFPEDFMFPLTQEEYIVLRSQIVTLKTGRGQHRKYLPLAFTEHGALMAASVLNSSRAVEMSIFVVRAFVKLKEIVITHKALALKLEELEKRVGGHDAALKTIIEAIRQLMTPPQKPKRRIGFRGDEGANP